MGQFRTKSRYTRAYGDIEKASADVNSRYSDFQYLQVLVHAHVIDEKSISLLIFRFPQTLRPVIFFSHYQFTDISHRP